MSIETTLKIWDMLGYQQEAVLYRVSLGIFEVIGKRLLQEDYEKIIGLIKSFGSYADENKVLEAAVKSHIVVSDSKLDRMIKKLSKKSLSNYERE